MVLQALKNMRHAGLPDTYIPRKRSTPSNTDAQVADLKAMCKERGITGYSKYRKSQLVRVLKDAMLVEME